MWTCKNCNETNADDFDTCWSCKEYSQEAVDKLSKHKKESLIQKFLMPFKKLPAGFYRLVIALGFIIPLIIAISEPNALFDYDLGKVSFFKSGLLPSFFVYWILARVGVWIYIGFTKKEE